MAFSTGMLSLYCSIAKASLFAGLGFLEEALAANTREKRE
jgi:hypothetical protein